MLKANCNFILNNTCNICMDGNVHVTPRIKGRLHSIEVITKSLGNMLQLPTMSLNVIYRMRNWMTLHWRDLWYKSFIAPFYVYFVCKEMLWSRNCRFSDIRAPFINATFHFLMVSSRHLTGVLHFIALYSW